MRSCVLRRLARQEQMARAKQQLHDYWRWCEQEEERAFIASYQEAQSRLRLRMAKRGVEGLDLRAAIVSLVLLAR